MPDQSEVRVFWKREQSLAQGIKAVLPQRLGTVSTWPNVIRIGAIAVATAKQIESHHVVFARQIPTEIAPHAAVGEDAMDEDDGAIMLRILRLILVNGNFIRMFARANHNAIGGHLNRGCFGFDYREIRDAIFGLKRGSRLATGEQEQKNADGARGAFYGHARLVLMV